MKQKIRIIIVEDSVADATLAERELRKGLDVELKRVDSQHSLEEALQTFPPDMILSDYNIPGFGGKAALEIARVKCPEVPFIFVSGTIGEEAAVESLKNGATDYVIKDNLVRLLPSVRRALKEIEERNDKKRLEAQYLQMQKMEAIGRLAGGVAHDFNNLLTAISGYSHFLLGSMDAADPRRADVEEIKKAGERAASLTRQLLAFSRQQTMQLKVININGIVLDMEKMIRRLIGEDITLDSHIAKDLAQIKADPGQIEQVILNLVVNARDAMPTGGKLTLETANITLGEEYASKHPEITPGPYVMLAVSDTGFGMSKETLARIFEPFFTTKEEGKGTGLGMATVYGIVKQSRGSILIYSEVNNGTSVKVYFPAVFEDVCPIPGLGDTGKSVHGTETILLVEDEESVQKFIYRALTQNGYSVLTAQGAKDALRIAREYGAPVHLLVTDIVMPQMRGDELAKQVLAVRPDIKIVFTSGYSEAGMMQRDLLRPGIHFLQKPLEPATLARKIRDALDGVASA